MTVKIPVQIGMAGADKAVQDFEAIRKAVEKTAKEAAGMTSLAKSLGQTYKEAKTLTQTLNLTAEEAVAAIAAMRELESVGADSATQFQILSVKMGLNIAQFEALKNSMSGQKETIAQVVAGYASLAQTIGGSYDEAEAFAKELGLTSAQAKQAVVQLRELQQAGVSTALQYQVLEESLGITVTQFDQLEAAARGAGKALDGAQQSGGMFSNVMQGVAQGIGQKGFDLLSGTLASLPGQIAAPTLQFEKFKTVLTTLYGNADKADEAFAGIQQFAATTPFELSEVTDMFIMLKNRGIEPTKELMQNMGDIASSQGKSLNQFTEAVLDSTSFEFERLKEFGIKAEQAGNKVSFTFKGVTQTVEKTPEAIQGAIQAIGRMQGVAGGMEAQSKTLGGSLSNLSDNTTKLMVSFGEELIPVLVEFVGELISGVGGMESFAKSAGQTVGGALQMLSNALKFVKENATVFQAILAVLVAQMAAMRAIALWQSLLQLAVGMTGAATGTAAFSAALGAAQVAMKGFLVSTLALAPALIALGAAVALVALVKMTADMKAVNEELDLMANTATRSMNEFGQIAGRVKSFNDAFKANGTLTAEQVKQAKGYIQVSKEKLKAIDAEIAAAQAIAGNVNASKEQRSAAEAAVIGLTAQKNALEAQTKTLEGNLSAIEKRSKTIQNAEEAEKELKKITEGVKGGDINQKDAIAQLKVIRDNAKAGKEAREQAAEEISKLIETQAKEEESILEGQLAKGVITREQYNKKLLQSQMSANDAEIKQLEEQRSKIDAKDEAGLRAVNAKLGEAYKKRADIQRQAYQRDLEMIDDRNDKALDAAKLSETKREIEIAKLRKSGQFSEGELAQKEIESKIKNIDAELEAERKKYEELKKLQPATEEDRAKQEDQLRSSQQKMAELTLSRVNQEIAAEENLRKQAIAAIKERQQKAKLASDATVRGIREQVGELNRQNQAQEMILKSLDREQKLRESAAAVVSAQMEAEISRYNAQIEALNTAVGLVREARDAEDTPDEGRLKILDEEKQKIDEINEAITGDKSAREYELKLKYAPDGRDNEQEAAKKRQKFEEENQKLQKEFQDEYAQTELVNAEASRKLAEQQRQTQRAIAEEKKREEEAAKVRQQQLLTALGLAGKTEVELIQRKQKLEDQQAAAKAKAQQAEMALARQQMDMNVRRMAIEARMQLIAAKRAELEAKISVEKAKQAVTDAKAELAQAKLIQDPKERKAAEADAKSKVKDAQLDLKLTEDEYAFAKDNTQFSQQNIEDTKVLARQQQETLAIQQASANEVARQEEGLRTMNQALELSKAGAEGFAGALDKAAQSAQLIQQSLGTKPAAPQPRRLGGSVRAGEPYLVGEAGPELITPSRNGWVFTAKQTARILADVQPVNPAALPTGTISQIVAFRRDAAMLEELKKLRGQVEGMRPVQEKNTFNLNSNQLVADAAELHLKIAKNRLRRSRR